MWDLDLFNFVFWIIVFLVVIYLSGGLFIFKRRRRWVVGVEFLSGGDREKRFGVSREM